MKKKTDPYKNFVISSRLRKAREFQGLPNPERPVPKPVENHEPTAMYVGSLGTPTPTISISNVEPQPVEKYHHWHNPMLFKAASFAIIMIVASCIVIFVITPGITSSLKSPPPMSNSTMNTTGNETMKEAMVGALSQMNFITSMLPIMALTIVVGMVLWLFFSMRTGYGGMM